jgi:hypothetical protein
VPKVTGQVPTCGDSLLSAEELATRDYLDALHESGHAIVSKAVGHDVYVIHIGKDGCYCESGYIDKGVKSQQQRALTALGGYFAVTMFGQGLGFFVNNWENAADDLKNFEENRNGMSFRHVRNKVTTILRMKSDELLALAKRVVAEKDVFIDPEPKNELD